MTPENSSPRPFGDIALCLSGGGYRAASFALGTIDMLDELDLLRDVKLFSTVSGGTFTGMTYAAWLSENKTYGQFYDDFYKFLENTNCVNKALDDLYDTPSPSGSTDLSLIRSAARAYADGLFKDRTFKQLSNIVGGGKPFKELIFNTTEFRTGNSFRFRGSYDPRVFIGNQIFAVPRAVAEEVRLADIVAASSCFPGAFEPIRFPDDFQWTSELSAIRADLKKDVTNPVNGKVYANGFNGGENVFISAPLMDGGIYDNQGTASALLADNVLREHKENFGLFLITDTSQRNDAMLNFPTSHARRGWITVNALFWFAVGLFLLSLINICVLAYYFFTTVELHRIAWFELTLFFIAPAVFSIIIMGILIWIYRLFLNFKTVTVSGAKFELWNIVKRLSLPDFIEMVKARFSSLTTMAGDVFMKRIRQLQFNIITNDPKRGKLVSFNLIYDLNLKAPPVDLFESAPYLQPTPEMVKISKDAEAIATTLWIGKKDLDTLIVCGQVTTCFSLLRHLWQRWEAENKAKTDAAIMIPPPNDEKSPFYEIYRKLDGKWKELIKDPWSSLNRKRV